MRALPREVRPLLPARRPCLPASPARAATNDLTTALQRGLFEEEANQNLGAAIQAYQTVANQFDKDRKLAATAIFRLGECYRKQGNTNDAAAQYERILREFSDQPTLVTLSRQSLAGWAGAHRRHPPRTAAYHRAERLLEGSRSKAVPGNDSRPPTATEAEEVKRIQALIKDSPDLINAKATACGGLWADAPSYCGFPGTTGRGASSSWKTARRWTRRIGRTKPPCTTRRGPATKRWWSCC